MHIIVNGVNKRIFMEFKKEAKRRGMKLGEALNLAMKSWLDE